MSNTRAPGVGITRALETLGGDDSRIPVTLAGSQFNDGRTLCAAALDRHADLWLSVGRHSAAERLAHQAADLRQAVAT